METKVAEKNKEIIAPVLELEAIDTPALNALEKKDVETFRIQQFNDEEMAQIQEFSEKIDLRDANLIITYGAGTQKRMAEFSDSALSQIRAKDLDEVGEMLSDLVADLKTEPGEKKGLAALFSKAGNKLEKMKAHYSKVSSNVDAVAKRLEEHQVTLLKDVAVQDMLFDNNKAFFKELTMYIAAGKIALRKAVEEELPKLKAKAAETGLAEDAQEVKDFASMCERFEKKLHDLDLTRVICLQNAPQIRLVQNNAIILSDKIHSAIVNTLPLWKNQMIIALGMVHAEEAIKAQTMVTDTTNEILRKNAEMLHQTTVDIATENERGIVDLETLQHTNEELIATLDDILRIQAEGRAKRQAAEKEMINIENNLKQKLVEVTTVNG
ncbi:MAG: toxic anion resistance protein [Lentihominibacter sp.]|jgi:uncharacterized protein YaaN involved in tellurite resistance